MLSNITSINLDLQTQGSALVAKQVNALVSPARRIYVFGTATDAFPYFSTFANALTYANSLTPSTTNPVSIVLLSKSDNTPVTITGNDDWYALCLDGIYVSSPYREIFSTTTLPTTLPKGMRVLYRSGGNETLYVGNDSNVAQAVGGGDVSVPVEQVASIPTSPTLANGDLKIYQDSVARGYLFQGDANTRGWPSVGYKEFSGTFSQANPTANLTGRIFVNTLGSDVTFIRTGTGVYTCTPVSNTLTANNVFFPNQAGMIPIYEAGSVIPTPVGFIELTVVSNSVQLTIYDSANDTPIDLNSILGSGSISISFIHVQGTVVV